MAEGPKGGVVGRYINGMPNLIWLYRVCPKVLLYFKMYIPAFYLIDPVSAEIITGKIIIMSIIK